MKYKQPSLASAVRFEKAPLSEIEFSKMSVNPRVYTTYNAGDIVPVYCEEILPHSTFSMDVDFVNRLLSATIKPTMGAMQMDIYAFFVPNRVVNESWKNVQGENTSGYWAAPEVNLAPLYRVDSLHPSAVMVPVGSVADYYGFPTQAPIQANVLAQCNDLKFKGYLSIYNNYFRDQNYQAPIPFSKLNLYQGFFRTKGSAAPLGSAGNNVALTVVKNGKDVLKASDGSIGAGAINEALYGEGSTGMRVGSGVTLVGRFTEWSALDKPLKANKLHDYFTSGLPSPQKGSEIYFGIGESAPIITAEETAKLGNIPLKVKMQDNSYNMRGSALVLGEKSEDMFPVVLSGQTDMDSSAQNGIIETNLLADLTQATGVSINDLRIAVATQQVYEMLARGGSRYLESLRTLFGIEAENPFKDIPTQLGHIRRELDLYQVAQTSASEEGNTPQGNLSGFGYTAKDGDLFSYTSLEHGYIHILAVVRHRNIYATYLSLDNFRLSTLDFYAPPLANIGEQPLKKALLNPFAANAMENSIAFQEAWAEYRYSPDRVSGYCRTGIPGGLDIWTYADPYEQLDVIDGDWLVSNSQEVLDRTLQVPSSVSPQFVAMFEFKITKQLPMPIYSVPGLDIL